MEPEMSEALIREFQIAEKQYLNMMGSRDRWRSVAMGLADQLYTRFPNLPDLERFYETLADPFDGINP